MISTEDQQDLFRLIADYLERDIICVAIGGTAMMFLGSKNATKDIDLVFRSESDRSVFIRAIEELGYRTKGLIDVYDEKRRNSQDKPLIFTRGEERFDLFVENVFGLPISTEAFVERRDFLGKSELLIHVLPREDLIFLKAVTGREKDYEDIEILAGTGNDVDWDYITSLAIQNQQYNDWILLDLEETLHRLRKTVFIKQKYFDRLYDAQR